MLHAHAVQKGNKVHTLHMPREEAVAQEQEALQQLTVGVASMARAAQQDSADAANAAGAARQGSAVAVSCTD
jgi:hypothetical protein